MTNLISGKEAMIALANGKEVEYWCETDPSIQKRWTPIKALSDYKLSYFLENKPRFEFRLKPRTITINGIEVPKPQKDSPKKGDDVFTLDFTKNVGGFTSWKCQNSINTFSREWWRTEEEIKQVVAALRKVFKGVSNEQDA